MSINDLPVEIVDLILRTFCANGFKDFPKYMLVCRSWRHILSSMTQYQRLASYMQTCRELKWKSFKLYSYYLSSECAELGTILKHKGFDTKNLCIDVFRYGININFAYQGYGTCIHYRPNHKDIFTINAPTFINHGIGLNIISEYKKHHPSDDPIALYEIQNIINIIVEYLGISG